MQVRTATDLGGLVRDQRRRLGWSQGELAERIATGRLWVNQLEKGKPTAQVGLVLRTLRVLGITLEATSTTTPAARGSSGAAEEVDLNRLLQGEGLGAG